MSRLVEKLIETGNKLFTIDSVMRDFVVKVGDRNPSPSDTINGIALVNYNNWLTPSDEDYGMTYHGSTVPINNRQDDTLIAKPAVMASPINFIEYKKIPMFSSAWWERMMTDNYSSMDIKTPYGTVYGQGRGRSRLDDPFLMKLINFSDSTKWGYPTKCMAHLDNDIYVGLQSESFSYHWNAEKFSKKHPYEAKLLIARDNTVNELIKKWGENFSTYDGRSRFVAMTNKISLLNDTHDGYVDYELDQPIAFIGLEPIQGEIANGAYSVGKYFGMNHYVERGDSSRGTHNIFIVDESNITRFEYFDDFVLNLKSYIKNNRKADK